MVVFTCNACGDSLKKNQVEKHYMTVCRRCEVLSCVDCGKDFWGEEYQKHTKCITEEEKYSGKNYQPKPNANKGEVKQLQWTQQVQEAIDKSRSHPKLKNLLERMKEYPNIPRKKAKFENFVRNSLNTKDNNLIAQVWDLLIANAPQKPPTSTKDNNGNNKESENSNNDTEKITNNIESVANGHKSDEENNSMDKKLSKRERKEERQKKLHKKEKKDKSSVQEETESIDNEDVKKKAKKKKRKREQEEEDEEDISPKKIKHTNTDDEMECSDSLNHSDIHVDNADQEKKTVKFNWEKVITQVLTSKGEISLKRLRKKVIAEYISQGCKVITEEKLWTKFNKKVNKNPTFVVLKDRVKLKKR